MNWERPGQKLGDLGWEEMDFHTEEIDCGTFILKVGENGSNSALPYLSEAAID